MKPPENVCRNNVFLTVSENCIQTTSSWWLWHRYVTWNTIVYHRWNELKTSILHTTLVSNKMVRSFAFAKTKAIYSALDCSFKLRLKNTFAFAIPPVSYSTNTW